MGFARILLLIGTLLLTANSFGQVIEFTSTAQTGAEDIATFTATVQLDVAAGVDIDVPFTVTGTATEGALEDYTITLSPLTFLVGVTTQDIVVTINDDVLTESDETVIITLETPTSGSLGTDIIHTATIEDNDTPPTVSILTPADASSFAQGALVDFTGTANDDEDGDLTDNIDWSSSIDGSLGTGGAVSTTTLSAGVHTITASVTDASLITVTDDISITITNDAPVASALSITGTLEVGQVLTGDYTYSDTENDLEGTSTYRWLRDGVEIVGATATTYTLDVADDGTMISFEVTPVALTGTLSGIPVVSSEVGPILPANTAPTATGVAVTGTLEVGQVLTGDYTFDDADGDLEGTSTYRWLRDGVEIVGATATTYTLDVLDDGTMISFEVTPVAATGVSPGTAVVSPEVGPIGAANTVPTASAVTVTGTLEVGQILTGTYTYTDADGDLEGTSTFRWLRDGVEIVGATALTYTLDVLDDGAMISFEVTPVAATGVSPGTAVVSPEVGPVLPANTAPTATGVAVTGTLEVGQLLTGDYTFDDADGDLEGTSTYRWLRDGVEIVGATATTYTLDVADDGTMISFEVTPVALTGVLTGTAVVSPEVGPVLPANTAPTATGVAVTGTLEVGQLLTGDYTFDDADGDLEGTSTYRWLRDGVEIVGATATTYTLDVADDGTMISFEVTPVALTGVLTGTAVVSPEVGPVLPANTAPTATGVAVTGTLEVGQLLTGDYTFDDADGDLEGTSTYRWLRDGVEIVGATATTYTLDVADDGTMISFEVTPVALTGVLTGTAVVSPEVGPVLPANTAPTATGVAVTGTLEVGQLLTGDYTFDDADGDLEGTSTYRWLRDGVEIVGATATTYTLDVADDGTMISFEVTPVALTGVLTGTAVVSPEVGPVLPANTAPTATGVAVTGTLEVGQLLTGDYTFDDADGDLEGTSTYRWLRDGVEIVGATATTYTLDVADDGTMISFEVTPVALTGVLTGTAVVSPEVGPILPANTAPTATGVAVTGTLEVGQLLTGDYTFDDADGDLEGTSTYRWLRDGVEIVGATATTYTLDVADDGTMISFEVTPVALTGVLTGTAVVSPEVGPVLPANTAPTATGVAVTGTLEVGQVLTGDYTFDDADGDLEGTSTYRWLRDGVEIVGATATTYTLDVADDGTMISFEVTPVALTGVLTGTAVVSPEVGPILPANTAPTATGVAVTGTLEVGQLLTGDYTFDDADGDLEGTSTYRWLRDGVEIVGATATTYTLDVADDGTMISFEVTPVALTGVLTGTAVVSPEVGPVIPANTAPVASSVLITGNLEVGELLTGNYVYTDADGDLEGVSLYRWLRDGVTIGGATAQTYTLVVSDESTTISFEVTPVSLTGVLVGTAVESPGVGPIGAANTVPIAIDVSISGITEVGEILTGNYTFSDADGDVEAVSLYRWFRDGVVIAGASFQTYTLEALDEDAMITFEVTPVAATGALIGTPVVSPEVGPVVPANTAPTATDVTITGVTEVGQILTGNYTFTDADGDLEGTSTYRWLRDGLAITGATAVTYTLVDLDEGADVIFEVTPIAVTGVLTGAAVQSPSVGPIVPANTAPTASDLSITGVTEVGQLLTGNYTYTDVDGDLEGTSLFRWFRDGVEISGATALTYTLTTSDENTTITFEVTPVALTGVLTGAAVVSAGVGPIGAANAIPTATDVLISGNTEVGQELTASYTFDDLDGDLEGTSTFRWLRDDVEIAGATALTYSLVDLDEGTNIIFEVTPVAATGASPGSPVQSPAVGPIDAANEPPVATDLSITGDLEVGQVLTGVYTYSDPDGDLEGVSTFRWLRDGVAIIGATAISYTLQDTDEGANISFEVVPVALTGDTPGSPSQSASVGPVLPANTAPVASSVSITGTTEVGFSLTGSYSYSDADGDLEGTSTFRWLRDNVEIAGATALSYTLQSADQGATILFEVTPVALTGVLTGNPVLSSAVGPIGAANTIPTALDVNIAGTAEVGQQLTGIYTFSDADGDQEGTSTYRWLRDDIAIPGETDINYTVAAADLDAFITFEITPVSLTGALTGSPVQSAAIGPVVPANSAPIATAVTISGTAEEGQQLNGLYTYTDADGDLEGTSTFRWLRDGVAIDGAIAQSYRLESTDIGTSIIFEITPAAATGVSPGRQVQSASIGPIRAADIEPISITPVNLPRLHNAGTGSETYNISVGGDIEVERVLFIFKGLTAGDDGWVTRDLTSTTGEYSVTLTEEAFDEMGLEYEFVASDVEGNSVNILGYTYIQYPVDGMDFESLVFGNSVSDYNLISFPLELDNPSINSVLEDDLGPYDQAEWRLFGHLSTGVQEYQSGLSVLERGKGYWLIVRNPTDISSGSGSTELITDQEFQMALEPGWNLIGNPYSFNLSWQDVLAVNPLAEGVDAQLTLYKGGYQNADILNIMEGAFVFSEQNVTLSVPLQKDESIQGGRIPPPILEKSMTSESWEILLEVSSDLLSNQVGGFGMNVDAKESKDAWDGIRPPRFLEYLDISFEHQEYFAPNFSRDIVPLGENRIWNFTVESNVRQERLTLNWESLAQLDSDKELWLVHADLQRAINMKILQRYAFKYQAINNFKIVYGSSNFVKENLLPESASIAAAYPNPFTEQLKIAFALPENQSASQVDLAIYDLQGRKVKSLWQDRYRPGFYETIWDGTNTTGKAVSSGVYLLIMNVSGQESIYRRVVKY